MAHNGVPDLELLTIKHGDICLPHNICAMSQMQRCAIRPTRFAASPRPLTHTVAAKACLRDTETSAARVLEKARDSFDSLCSVTLGAVASGLLLFTSPASAEIQRFPASDNPEVAAVQKTLIEAWDIVDNVFVDPTGQEWRRDLRTHLMQAYKAPDSDSAYTSISSMLKELGDPYTRLVLPEEYATFRTSSSGEVQGVGLLIASDPSSGRIVVLAPIRGSPADKAGVLPGDEVVSINGRSTRGLDGKEAAKSLRGKNGTTVSIKLARRTDGIPGVPARIEEKQPKVQYKSVQIKRQVVELNPVYYSNIEEAGKKLGYIKLTNFSDKASKGIQTAVDTLEQDGAEAFVLDLRSNPGGLVQAGLDIARIWLDGPATVFHISGRNSVADQDVKLSDGNAATDKPLVVLVDQDSASASEILAGALHDNRRAKIIGDRTFGKGKIQNVFELQDGSALFVTVARYQTPNNVDIDKIGIAPDLGCFPERVGPAPRGEGRGVQGPAVMETKSLIDAELELDNCFITAERLLNKQIANHS